MSSEIMIAAYVPYAESEKNAHKSVSHMSGEAVLAVVIICALVLFWFFRKGK
jgi:hypothetical protein